MINLFYNYYNDNTQERAEEIKACAGENLKNDTIDKIYLFNESEESFHNNNVTDIKIASRPLFKDVFEKVSLYSKDNDINVIINSDCFLDTDDTLKLNQIGQNEAWCILRTEIKSINPFKLNKKLNKRNLRKHSGDMQDGWVFVGKPKQGMWLNFHLGTPGCDNRLAYEFQNVGYSIKNPGIKLKLYHFHNTKIRTYSELERVPEPYAFPTQI